MDETNLLSLDGIIIYYAPWNIVGAALTVVGSVSPSAHAAE